MRNHVDPVNVAVLGAGVNAASNVSASAGNFAEAVLESNMSGWYKFLLLLTFPMPFALTPVAFCLDLSFQAGMILVFFGGLFVWPMFVLFCSSLSEKKEASNNIEP